MRSLVVRSVLIAATVFVCGCASLPPATGRKPSSALQDTAATPLGAAVERLASSHPGSSGIHPLVRPLDAFAARALLARAAQRSLDLQYYIWHGDTTGNLLFEELWRAAERGVRVRLLLDDQNTRGLDPTIAALDAHPNIEVRLFNPFPSRGFRFADYLTDFGRTNRRMHNKSFTADNQVAIVGGRNVGNEYFGGEGDVVFADLDVLAVGPVVREVSSVFDLYWNSESAYPAGDLVASPSADGAAMLQDRFEATRAAAPARAYLDALRATVIEQLHQGSLPIEWTTARVVYDEPSKVLAKAERSELLLARLERMVGRPQRSFEVVSPYFVPAADGTAALSALAAGGVQVRIITNSLAATDVTAVHAGYAKRRKPLLQSGVQLFELKSTASDADSESRAKSVAGSSSASLHAKTFAIDGARVFVGSFNFDPRSASLNTEMGVVVDSPTLAGMMKRMFETVAPRVAYEVRLRADGELEWIERDPAGERRLTSEPGVGLMRRLGVGALSLLPIEWML